jgi:hypothetical protein
MPDEELTEEQLMLLWLEHEREQHLMMLSTLEELPEDYSLEIVSHPVEIP